MSEIKSYIQKLFSGYNIPIQAARMAMFDQFVAEEYSKAAVNQILELQKVIMDNWTLKNRITDIIQQPLQIPNATVEKPYSAHLNFEKLNWSDIVCFNISDLEQHGLQYDENTDTISGTPITPGDFKITIQFRVKGEPDNSELNCKYISLVINANPKSLWKNIASDKEDKYWKEDNVEEFKPLGTKHIVVSSKRGRSHANVGSFRDDDYAFKHFEKTGWSVIAVADGAGSAKLSRKGSQIACQEVINFFENTFSDSNAGELDLLATERYQETIAQPIESQLEQQPDTIAEKVESAASKISKFIYANLGAAAKTVHNKLEQFATENEVSLKDLHSTLIFALFKKYDFGYVVLSFGVGDCPIGLLNKDMSELQLMNWLDVGEFGGGTRFITMPEIFVSDKFSTRFKFKIIPDFSYLILMTDGIYDPKFVVEANLEKLDKWKEFIADIQGNNEDKANVVLDKDNAEIAQQLATWMDFWSAGNHDDRTLAIVF